MIWTRYKPRLYRWYCIQWREQRSDVLAGWGRENRSPVCRIKSENFQFQLSFYRSLFVSVQLTKSRERFRWWLGAEQATSRYLRQRWLISMTKMCVTPSQWVKRKHLGLREWLLENVINCILIASCIITLWLPFECFLPLIYVMTAIYIKFGTVSSWWKCHPLFLLWQCQKLR